jgi:hypothetical protein
VTKLFTKDGDEFKEVDAFLQPEVDSIVAQRLDRERGKFADYDTLKEKANQVDTVKTEYETKLSGLATEKSELEKKLTAATLETEKVKIVHKFKLPEELHEFVTGNDADEMAQRAEKLAKGYKPNKVVIDKNGKPENANKTDSKTMAGKLFGSKSDD